MNRQIAQTSPAFELHAERVVCDIRDRVTGGLVRFGGPTWRTLLITAGQVAVRRPQQEDLQVEGPALLWLPWSPEMRIVGRAGSTFDHLLMTELTLANAIGHKPESTEMRDLSQAATILRLQEAGPDLARMTQCFSIIVEEIAANGPGTEIVVEAQVRMILIQLWRQSLRDVRGHRPAMRQHWVLPAFRQLIEAHFRDRWSIGRYAGQLNVTPDRLHDICTKALDRPPRLLVQQRLIYEAQLLLERSSKSMDEIAEELGFRTAAHFNRAFRTATGSPPARYRKSLRRQADAPAHGESFADWP